MNECRLVVSQKFIFLFFLLFEKQLIKLFVFCVEKKLRVFFFFYIMIQSLYYMNKLLTCCMLYSYLFERSRGYISLIILFIYYRHYSKCF